MRIFGIQMWNCCNFEVLFQLFMRKILFSIVLLLSICSAFSQYAALDMPTEQYLNRYVIYINDNIHALRVFHKQYEKFNKDINAYYKDAPFDKVNRQAFEAKKSISLKFEVPPVMKDKAAFDPLPEELYAAIKKEMPNIDPTSLQVLHERIDELHSIAAEIQNVSQNLEEYCLNGAYLDDPNLEIGYRILHRIQILLHDFSESKDLMYYELRRVQNGFVQPNLNNPYVRSGNKLLTFDLYARNVLVALKKGDKQAVEEQLPLMETALEDMRSNATAYLQGITEVVTLDQYAAAVRKSEVFVKIVHEYLENPYVDGKYAAYGTEYYYYNSYFLGNYNRYGAGIIMEYNKFVDLSDQPMLKMHEEPHWLTIRPQPVRPDAPKKPEPVPIPQDTIPKGSVVKMQAPDIKEKPKPKPEAPKDTVVVAIKPVLPPPIIEPEELAGAAPVNFVFLLDVSGSMKMPYKLPVLKQAFTYLISLLRPDDRVAIVLYSGNAKVVLPSTTCNQKDKILQAIDDIQSSGESDVLKGSKLAYKVAKQNFLKDGNNRVILATDGGIEISQELLSLITQSQLENNIYLSLLYFEEKEYAARAQKLKSLSNAGKGNYSYVTAANSNESLLKEAKAVRRK